MTDMKNNSSTSAKNDGTNKIFEKYLKDVDDDDDSADEEDVVTNASAQSLGVRAQKKLLSKFSSKTVAKVFIDENSGRVLDSLHKLMRNFTGSKKEADKLLKSIIKTIVKLGVLYKNDIFNEQELKAIDAFRNRFHSLAKAIVTFYEVDYSADCHFLIRICRDCQDLTHQIISTHLTNKSHTRLDYVFNTVSNLQFLEFAFDPNSAANRAIMKDIVHDMHALMDGGLV